MTMLAPLRRLMHPRWQTHVRHADGQGSAAQRARYAAHLLTCAACRREHTALVALTTAAHAMPAVQPPAGAWSRIVSRLDDGDAVVLPTPALATPPRAVLPRAAAALAAAAAIAIVALWPSRQTVYAASSELRVRPLPGTHAIELRYTNPARCRTCRALVVRVRWRTAGDARSSDEVPTVVAGTLSADGESMVGTIQAPADALVGFVSLESTDATWTDNNENRSWAVMPWTPPSLTLEARRAAILDLLDRDWEGALRLSRELVADFPDSAVAWSDLIDRERQLPQDSALAARNLAVLQRLDARDRGTRDSTGAMAARMFRLAWGAYDVAVTSDTSQLPPIMRYWLGRVHDAPQHTAEVRHLRHVVELQALYAKPSESLRHLERLWREDSSDYFLFSVGVQTARRVSDTTAMIRWYRRLAILRPNTEGLVAARLSQFAPSRSEGIARLRAVLTAGGQEEHWRALGESRDAFRRRQQTLAGQAQFALSGALLAVGDVRGSDQALITAAAAGWNTRVFEALATRMLIRGDSARALQALALLRADPTRPADDSVRLRARVGRFFDARTAQRWRDSGAVLLRAHLLSGVAPVLLAGPLTDLTRADRQPEPVTTGARPRLVSFWSPGCAPSISDLAQLAAVQSDIAAHGLTLLAVSRERNSRVSADTALSGLRFATDPAGTLHRALRQWMTPERFLIIPGRAGAWRVELDVSELPLLAAALETRILDPR